MSSQGRGKRSQRQLKALTQKAVSSALAGEGRFGETESRAGAAPPTPSRGRSSAPATPGCPCGVAPRGPGPRGRPGLSAGGWVPEPARDLHQRGDQPHTSGKLRHRTERGLGPITRISNRVGTGAQTLSLRTRLSPGGGARLTRGHKGHRGAVQTPNTPVLSPPHKTGPAPRYDTLLLPDAPQPQKLQACAQVGPTAGKAGPSSEGGLVLPGPPCPQMAAVALPT